MSEQFSESVAVEPTGEISWGDPAPETPAEVPVDNAPAETPVALPEAPPEPQDISISTLENGEKEIRLATGQVYRGKDDASVIMELGKAQLEASRYTQTLKQQLEAAQKPPMQESPAEAALDPAAQYFADSAAQGLGFKDASELKEAIQFMKQQATGFQSTLQQQQLQQVAVEFVRSTPDFTVTPGNTAKLEETLDKMCLPPTVENIRFAHYALKGQGAYEAPQPRTEIGQFAPKNNMPLPPTSGAPNVSTQAAVDPFSLSDEEFKQQFAQRVGY